MVTFLSLTILLLVGAARAEDDVAAAIDARADEFAEVAHAIWEYAELGYVEERSSALLQEQLVAAGFRLERGVAGIPTAFIAEYGSGRPVVALLAEFDALPGLSQQAVAVRQPRVAEAPGHACGHHLFGTGSLAAAVTVAEWLQRTGAKGTIRLYGTPAEEGGSGKVYMVRAGLFADVDAVLNWHPSDRNTASPRTTLANKSAKFRFHGIATHAAMAPERGRSALDGVESMNYMVNMMREHLPQDSRVHYVITRGGAAPNIVPEFAEVFYYVRHPDGKILPELWDRVVKAGEGAALGTGTTMDYEVIHGNYNKLPNVALSRQVDANLRGVGGVEYTAKEQAFAEDIRTTLGRTKLALGSEAEIQPFALWDSKGSTDVGDVSWIVPTSDLGTATWVPGTASHSWQAVAAGGTGIGSKGMIVAAKVLALTAVDLFLQPELVATAKAELMERRGEDFVYAPLLGDREPPLDYRK
ncbi:MAG TPA: amidohydrolase [Candidatus Latescibacteria bacterium]|nr:amidohydrolase [Candidatus Handelsmanbacteria bacterium]HIL07733.1 amidohydrolase [Candidatus Latescibacterota bacterium]